MHKITEAELEVMKLLWNSTEAMTFAQIRDRLYASEGWSNSTVKTLIQRLVDKGAVEQTRQGVFYYRPLVDQAAYSGEATRQVLRNFYGGSVSHLVANLISQEALSQEDLEELRRILHEEGGEK